MTMLDPKKGYFATEIYHFVIGKRYDTVRPWKGIFCDRNLPLNTHPL